MYINIFREATIPPELQKDGDTLQPVSSQCSECLWLHRDRGTSCDAFPKGIPMEMVVGAWDHTVHFDLGDWDDEGITFEPMDSIIDKTQKSDIIPYALKKAAVLKTPDGARKAWLSRNRSPSEWKKVGHQRGSNDGGVYELHGVKHYVKFPNQQGQIAAEVASDKIHSLLGIPSMGHEAITVDGRHASVSKWQEVKPLGAHGWAKLNPAQMQQAANAFVASALTKNWDVVGLVYDNIGKTKDGSLAIIDTGGSFNYRAQGGLKSFDGDPTAELMGMLSPEKTSGQVFAPLMKKHREMFVEAAKRLKETPNAVLLDAVKGMGHDIDRDMALLSRKNAIVKFFGV